MKKTDKLLNMDFKLTPLACALVALFTALISVGAFIRLPIPYVPLTLQVFFVYLSGMVLGGKLGMVCTLLYLVLGLFGVPVFVNGGGVGYIYQPTFGYIIGFVVASGFIGFCCQRIKKVKFSYYLLINLIGMVLVYVCGIAYFYVLSNYLIDSAVSLSKFLMYSLVVAIPGDIISAVIASLIGTKIVYIIRNKLTNYRF